MKPKILVTAAGGKTSGAAAYQLLEKGFPVRALLRSDDARAQQLRSAGADVVIGDMGDMGDMRRAVSGCQRAIFCGPTAANTLHYGSVFAAAATEAKLEHIVMLGAWLASAQHPSLAMREVYLNGERFKDIPGATLTVNNTGWFADNYFLVLEPIAQLGLMPMPLGKGLNPPPSNEDIASVSVGAIINPEDHAGKTYRPTGPKQMSPDDIAEAFSEGLGRKVRYFDMPMFMFKKALKAQGTDPFFQTQIPYFAKEYQDGGFAHGGVTDAVERVGGREPQDFVSIVRDYAARRPEAKRSAGNFMKANAAFIKILLTPGVNSEAVEAKRNHVLPRNPLYCLDDKDWLINHPNPDDLSLSLGANP